MFTFALALFAAIDIYFFIFKLFLLFVERERRNMEESISQQKPLTTITKWSGIECQIDRLPFFAATFYLFQMHFKILRKTYEYVCYRCCKMIYEL